MKSSDHNSASDRRSSGSERGSSGSERRSSASDRGRSESSSRSGHGRSSRRGSGVHDLSGSLSSSLLRGSSAHGVPAPMEALPVTSLRSSQTSMTKERSDVNSPNLPPPTQHEREDLFHKALASPFTIAELELQFHLIWEIGVSRCKAEDNTDIDLTIQWDWKLFYCCSLCVTLNDWTIFDLLLRMHAFNTLAEHTERRSDGDMANSRCFQFCKDPKRRLKQHAMAAVYDILTGDCPINEEQTSLLIDRIAQALRPDMLDIIEPSSNSLIRRAFTEYSRNNFSDEISEIVGKTHEEQFWYALYEKNMFNGLKSRLIIDICDTNRGVTAGKIVKKLCYDDYAPMLDFCDVPCNALWMIVNIRNDYLHHGMRMLSDKSIQKFKTAYHSIIGHMDYAKLFPLLLPFDQDTHGVSELKIDEKRKTLDSVPDKCEAFAKIIGLCESLKEKIGQIENQIASEKFKIRVLEKEIVKFTVTERENIGKRGKKTLVAWKR